MSLELRALKWDYEHAFWGRQRPILLLYQYKVSSVLIRQRGLILLSNLGQQQSIAPTEHVGAHTCGWGFAAAGAAVGAGAVLLTPSSSSKSLPGLEAVAVDGSGASVVSR